MKRLAQTALASGGLAALGRWLRRRDACVLTYHNVVPDDQPAGGDTSLHLRRSRFAAQLDLVARTHDVVPLTALLDERRGGRTRPRVAITFDDGYRGAMTLGVRELVDRGLPATVFVAPGQVGREGFWWDLLANGAPLSPALRRRALTDHGGADKKILAWARSEGWSVTPVGPLARPAAEDELQEAARAPGISFGSHTWSHRNLVVESDESMWRELVSSREWLAERFRSFVPWLAYPYGLVSEHVEARARDAGYAGAVRTRGGWIAGRGPRPFTLPRVDVPDGLPLPMFELRVAGFFCPT